MAGAAANGMTRITLSFLLSLLSENNIGPEAPANSKHHWSYRGPEGPHNWPLHYEQCAGSKQSPIDIQTARSSYDSTLGMFHLDNFNTLSQSSGPTRLNITNNGHAASVRVTSNMRVSGGGLNGAYKTAEFHFHWGSTDDVGSEHALDGRKFPLEMHVVNYAEKYGTIQRAMAQTDGLAVLGVFFQLSDTDNPEFGALDDALRYVSKAGEYNLVNRLRLRDLLPDDISRYWRYSGSLTTPFCFESVTWTVFATPQKISRTQLEALRSLLHEEGHDKGDMSLGKTVTPSRLVDNWRPLQPLNGRKIYRSFDDVAQTSTLSLSPEGKADSSKRHNHHAIKTSENNHVEISVLRTPIPPEDTWGGGEGTQTRPDDVKGENGTNLMANPIESQPSFSSKVKIKIGPVFVSGNNSVRDGNQIGSSVVETPTPGLSNIQNDLPGLQTPGNGSYAATDTMPTVPSAANNSSTQLNGVQQIQTKQQKLLELRKQQELQLQKLKELHLQQQRLLQLQQQENQNVPLHQQMSSLSPTSSTQDFDTSRMSGNQNLVQTNRIHLGAQSQARLLQQKVNGISSARSLGTGVHILNDGTTPMDRTGRGDQILRPNLIRQVNQPNSMYSRNPQQQKQLPQIRNPTLSSSAQDSRRYIKPLDQNIQFSFLRDGYTKPNQVSYLQPRQQQTRLSDSQAPVSYLYNSQYPYQRQHHQQQQQQQRNKPKTSLFSHLSNQAIIRQNSQSSGLPQTVYRSYPGQTTRPQSQSMFSRNDQQKQYRIPQPPQQQQFLSRPQSQEPATGTKLTADQLRRLLEQIANRNRLAPGTPTITSSASPTLPSPTNANAISATSNSGMRGVAVPRNNLRDNQRATGTRLLDQGNRAPATITSGRNPIPISINQRMRAVPGQIASQKISAPSRSGGSPSTLSSALSSPSSSFIYGNQPAYQIRNRSPTAFNRLGTFFTDMNQAGHQDQQDELPYVFLHRIEKPVRIRRPIYERLYNVQ